MTGAMEQGDMLSREALEAVVGFRVVDLSRYVTAFTHKSAGENNYERLEFIGDAVINFVVAKMLFDMYPTADEGFLTRIRTKLVSGENLLHLSQALGLHRFVLPQHFQTTPRVLKDVFQSLVGCIYMEHGMTSAKDFLGATLAKHVDFTSIMHDTNYKDGLMRYAQARGLPLPEYVVDLTPNACQVTVTLDQWRGMGTAASKKQAEQLAAREVLSQLGMLTPDGHVGLLQRNQFSYAPPARVANPHGMREALEATLGFKVADVSGYIVAFTHKSARGQSYERYEFIGDAVLNFLVAKMLYDMYPSADEGFLTRVRTKVVAGESLSKLSHALGLSRFVISSRRGLEKGIHTNSRILEDVFESLVGCIYLQHGMLWAKEFLLSTFATHLDFGAALADTNFKDGLMRHAQARGMPMPEYVMVVSPPRSRVFEVAVSLGSLTRRGSGSTKKRAEQAAAQCLLVALGV